MLWIECQPENAVINADNITAVFVQGHLLEEGIRETGAFKDRSVQCTTVDRKRHIIRWFDTPEEVFSYFNRLKIRLIDTRNGVVRV